MRENQEEWSQRKTVTFNLRKANKVRKQLEKEAFTLRSREREKNMVRKIPERRNEKSAEYRNKESA